MNKRSLLSALILLISLVFPGLALEDSQVQNPKFFFDQSTGGFFGLQNSGPAGFSELAEDLTGKGYIVIDNFMSNSNLGYVNTEALDASDTLVIINPKRTLGKAEGSGLKTFVEKGGTLIVICDSPESIASSNQILAPYDIFYKEECLLNTDVNISNNESINLTYCIALEESRIPTATFETYENKTFRINGTSEISRNLFFGNGNPGKENTVLMERKVFQGKVIAIGSKDFLTNSGYEQGKQFLGFILNNIEYESNPGLSNVFYEFSKLHIILKDERKSFVTLSLKNEKNTPLFGSFEIPDLLKEVVVPLKSNFTIPPGESQEVHFLFQDPKKEYGYINTTIEIHTWYYGANDLYVHKIPVEVEYK